MKNDVTHRLDAFAASWPWRAPGLAVVGGVLAFGRSGAMQMLGVALLVWMVVEGLVFARTRWRARKSRQSRQRDAVDCVQSRYRAG